MSVTPATALAVVKTVKTLVLTWSASTTPGATHTVYRSKGACGAFVAVATGLSTSYTDANVLNGEVYAYYVVATLNAAASTPSATVRLQFVGAPDQYVTPLVQGRPPVSVYAGVVAAGCGESERILKLKGRASLCGK